MRGLPHLDACAAAAILPSRINVVLGRHALSLLLITALTILTSSIVALFHRAVRPTCTAVLLASFLVLHTMLAHQACYFTLPPTPHRPSSPETPLSSPIISPGETPVDPFHPLLAFRTSCYPHLHSPQMPAPSTILQMQTAAAHSGSSSRPRPHPVQNVLHATSDDSTRSDRSSSSSRSETSSLDLARCSRCQRTSSIDVKTGRSSCMVQYGLNSWYCSRCAAMVGLNNG